LRRAGERWAARKSLNTGEEGGLGITQDRSANDARTRALLLGFALEEQAAASETCHEHERRRTSGRR